MRSHSTEQERISHYYFSVVSSCVNLSLNQCLRASRRNSRSALYASSISSCTAAAEKRTTSPPNSVLTTSSITCSEYS